MTYAESTHTKHRKKKPRNCAPLSLRHRHFMTRFLQLPATRKTSFMQLPTFVPSFVFFFLRYYISQFCTLPPILKFILTVFPSCFVLSTITYSVHICILPVSALYLSSSLLSSYSLIHPFLWLLSNVLAISPSCYPHHLLSLVFILVIPSSLLSFSRRFLFLSIIHVIFPKLATCFLFSESLSLVLPCIV